MNIYLARHGTTEWNALHRLQGLTDTELDKTGTDMAYQTGQRLSDLVLCFDHVFSSPLKRAYHTAQLLAGPSASVRTDERLRELCFGGFEGRNVDEMIADPDCAFRFFKTDPRQYNEITEALTVQNNGAAQSLPESLSALYERTSAFVKDLIEPLLPAEPDANILISGHGAVNRALLMYFKGITDFALFWGGGLQPNCGITRIGCTLTTSGSVSFSVQDQCMVLYDAALEKQYKNLFESK